MNNSKWFTPLLLWSLLVIYSAWGGWHLPLSQEAILFPSGLLGWAIALAPLPFFLLSASFPSKLNSTLLAKLEPYVNRIFGEGAYHKTFRQLALSLWLGVGSLLFGLVGLLRTIQLNAPTNAIPMCMFYISGGIGMVLLFLITFRRSRDLTGSRT